MISLILTLAVIGVILYLIERLPMDPTIIMVIRIIVVICVILWLVQVFGLDVPLPHWRR